MASWRRLFRGNAAKKATILSGPGHDLALSSTTTAAQRLRSCAKKLGERESLCSCVKLSM
jgi:hypothetical protein